MVESHRQEIAKLEALYASNPAGRVFVHLAEALRRGGEHERARSILEEGLARHPDSASGYVVLGRVLIDRGETEEAESAFRKVLELDGGNLVALRCLGDLARSGGRATEAVVHYRELIARNPASAVDSGLMRLLDDAERTAAEAAATAAPAPGTGAAIAADAPPEAGAAAAADTVAPGRTGPARPAEPEFGMIELDALPGDLASFAGLTSRGTPGVVDEPEPEPQGLEDDVVVLLESSAAPLELEELETELAASPAEVNLLSALPDAESPDAIETPFTLPSWMTDAPGPADDLAETAAADAAASAGDMDVDVAMLDVTALSAATPFEIVPEATELTLVDDDSVRVAMGTSDEAAASGDAEEASVTIEPRGDTVEAAGVEQTWAAPHAGPADDDARTQHPADVADEAAASEEFEDLPWLVAPTDSAGTIAGTGAGEDEPALAETAAAATDAGAERDTDFAMDLDPGAAGDGALDLPVEVSSAFSADAAAAPPDADAYSVPFDVVEDAPVSLDLTGEFEGPAEQFAAETEGPADSVLTGAEELEPAELSAISDRLDETGDVTAFAGTVEAAPDREAVGEPGEHAAEVAPLEELVEFAPDLGIPPALAAPEYTAFEEPEVSPDRDTLDETAELAADAGSPAEARFAEDVEAEPDLATFMERLEAGQEVAGIVTDADLAGYDERVESTSDAAGFAAEHEVEPHVIDYIEDIEAEEELAGYTDEVGLEADFPGVSEVDEQEPELAAYGEQAPTEHYAGWLDDIEAAGIEPPGAPATGGSVDEVEPFVTREEAVDDRSWQEEIAATGGPEPAFTGAEFGPADEPSELSLPQAEQASSPVAEARPAGLDAAAGQPSPTAGAGREDAVAGGASVTDLGTETLADLYLAQGFAQRAAEVYRALLRERPAEERLAAKLRDAEAALARSRGAEAGEDAGDVWLRGVESAWTGGAGATGQETTPYAWTEREEREQGIGIGAYLRDLISWGTRAPAGLADASTEPEPVAGAPEPVDADAAVAGEPRGASAETEWPAEPEPWGAESQPTPGEAERLSDSEPASAGLWSMAAEPAREETWSATEPSEPWSAPEEPPLDPWLAPEPSAVRGAAPDPASGATAGNPVEDAFNEWFGPPSEAAAPVASEPQSRPQPGPKEGPAESAEATAAEDEEDEDLEMFRAWLQSLKK